ncbi:GSCFA domain-containing protein [Mesonia ostreae]|uniref:GSCFA domain-containing protein n=1 Tax=Mesonia ostreae TaxID=861110 RepID=A0ABU2KG03_9FLAO|nr:GSCFA domain-containing protein [Mesonia ostreae]MDT0293630.1 GSCFA domain-containing protein [Mesonia ostreae]
MKLQTQVPIPDEQSKIDYASKLVLMGSCFSENIGEKLAYYKFQQLQNPFGILFHPFAIENLIEKAVQKYVYSEEDLIFHNEQWHCLDAHSKLSSSNKNELLQYLNDALKQTISWLKEASHVVFTFGTSWMYQHKSTGKYVANCHKIPQRDFNKKLISAEQIQGSIQNTLQLLQQIDPKLKVIITISPVRHLKDGFVENQQSKAALITAVHQSISSVKQSTYFPSYELMMDELRDYRFYKRDMLHPNALAIDYIWQHFVDTWVDASALPVMKKIETLQKNLKHKAFHPNSEAHQKFLAKLEKQKAELKAQYAHIQFP